mgnify:CR=1 FL=1
MLKNYSNKLIYNEFYYRYNETKKWFDFKSLDILKEKYDISLITYTLIYLELHSS